MNDNKRAVRSLVRTLGDGRIENRLQALVTLVTRNPKRNNSGGINLHVHTNESYSLFRSPTEAVWYAYSSGVEYFGINDHYTIDGHPEFRDACRIADLKPAFSIEAVAMDPVSCRANRRYNDPNNPGRCYLIGKGVTRNLNRNGENERLLLRMRNAIQRRNVEIVERLNSYAEKKGYSINITYEDVRRLTPRGNATERHVVQAFCEKLDSLSEEESMRLEIYSAVIGRDLSVETLNDPAALLTTVRAGLVKTGGACYVEEDSEAFTSIESLVGMYLEYGAIPSYPFMGGPVTEEEEDLDRLFKRVVSYGIYAFDVVEFRTPLDKAREIVTFAQERGFPVFIGTEHNTKRVDPIIGEIAKDSVLYGYLKRSAEFVIGHQVLSTLCDYGYVTEEGLPHIENLREGFALFSEVGAMDLTPERIEEIEMMDMTDRKKTLGIQ